MVENLYDTLSIHTLFHITSDIRDIHLLPHEILSAVSSDLTAHQQHDPNDGNSQNCKQRAQQEHGNESYHDRDE